MRKGWVLHIYRGAVIALLLVIVIAACVSGNLLRASVASAEAGVPVPILMYHSLLRDPARAGKYVVSPDTFRSDLVYLQAHGYTTVTMNDVIDYAEKGTPLPEKPIVLTFDDGYYNNYLYGFPILRELNAKAVISVIGYYTDLYSECDENNALYSHCTWEQLREMQESGLVEVQNHSYHLHTYDQRHGIANFKWEDENAYRQTVGEDLLRLQNQIRTELGTVPRVMVYPFGSYTAMSESLIRSLGFAASLSCETGITVVRNSESLYRMKRIIRPAGCDSDAFFRQYHLE